MIIEIKEHIDRKGRSPFGEWFRRLDVKAAAKVTTAIIRMELGNLSNVKGVGAGVFECRIDFGPGYRVYFGKDGEALVILVGGGTKKTQPKDIEKARVYWQEYKTRKREES